MVRAGPTSEGDDRTMTRFDSLAVARQLTDAGIERAHADAIADGISRAAEHGGHVTPDAFAAGLAVLRTEIGAVRTGSPPPGSACSGGPSPPARPAPGS